MFSDQKWVFQILNTISFDNEHHGLEITITLFSFTNTPNFFPLSRMERQVHSLNDSSVGRDGLVQTLKHGFSWVFFHMSLSV